MSIINNLIINMPIKWYGNGDLEDPIYKHFSRIVNFVIHCMIFTAIVSGTWLLKEINMKLAILIILQLSGQFFWPPIYFS